MTILYIAKRKINTINLIDYIVLTENVKVGGYVRIVFEFMSNLKNEKPSGILQYSYALKFVVQP